MEYGPAIAAVRAHQRLGLRRTEIRRLADAPLSIRYPVDSPIR
jgi:hypothetical protein